MTIGVRGAAQFFQAWLVLSTAHAMLRLSSFARVRRWLPSAGKSGRDRAAHDRALAEVWTALRRAQKYALSDATCLPLAIACVVMLRWRGVPADLVLGVQQSPFEAHAWAEVAGEAVSDWTENVARFTVLQRIS